MNIGRLVAKGIIGMWIPLLMAAILFCNTGSAQGPSKEHIVWARFGDLDTAVTTAYGKYKPSTNWKDVLANTKISVYVDEPLTVVEFTLGIMPEGMDFRGPYRIRGAEFTKEIKKMILTHLADNPSCKVFIENIRVIAQDRIERTLANPIIFTVTP